MRMKTKNQIYNIMKSKRLRLTFTLLLCIVISCNEPETVVTNIVHADGTVTRRIEMKNLENKFEISNIQVPFDSTWFVKDSLEFSDEGDTIWVKRAEKLYKSIDNINRDYQSDSGANKDISRRAEFRKKFKWFNTEFKFAEIIEKKMLNGYPIGEFLNQEELLWFYSPENVNDEKKNGPDSLKFRALNDTVDKKVDKWATKSLISEWIIEFANLTKAKAVGDMTMGSLKAREDEFLKIVEKNSENFDSLWSNGILLKEFIGEANALKYEAEADSAVNLVTDQFWVDFNDYTVRISMPGKLTGTNGFIDSSRILLWPVKSDFFLTEPYEMWAESRIPNKWAWIVSGFFLMFVIAGLVIRTIKKG